MQKCLEVFVETSSTNALKKVTRNDYN